MDSECAEWLKPISYPTMLVNGQNKPNTENMQNVANGFGVWIRSRRCELFALVVMGVEWHPWR